MLSVIMVCTLMGLSNRNLNLAIIMIVIMSETFFLPCAVRLLKVIFRKRILLRRPVSAQLLVGSIAGYFRNPKSSFLWVTSRLMILCLMVLQWRMQVQRPESFEDCLSVRKVFFGGQNEVLSMKGNSILNNLFEGFEKCLCIRVFRNFIVEDRLDVAE